MIPFDAVFDGMKTTVEYQHNNYEQTPLLINIFENASTDHCEVQFVFQTNYFSESEIQLLSKRIEHIIDTLPDQLLTPLKHINTLPANELDFLLHKANDTKAEYPEESLIHEIFESKAASNPDDTAVIYKGERYSYLQLNEKSNQLAFHLRKQGVGPETLVGVYIDHSVDMIVSLLGVLKAGGGYVPLDSSYPKTRLDFMINDGKLQHIITLSKLGKNLDLLKIPNLTVLDSKGYQKSSVNYPTKNLIRIGGQNSRNVAYVIYTSGSTGEPKGVMIEQKSLVNYLWSMQDKIGKPFGSNTRFLSVTTFAFDIAGLELWGTLLHGGTVVLASRDNSLDPLHLQEMIEKYDINCMISACSTWQLLANTKWPGKHDLIVLLGGEPLSANLASYLIPRCHQLWNCYGPTEATIISLVPAHRVRPRDCHEVNH